MKMYTVSMWLAKNGRANGGTTHQFTIPAESPEDAANLSLSYLAYLPFDPDSTKWYDGWTIEVNDYRLTPKSLMRNHRFVYKFTDEKLTRLP